MPKAFIINSGHNIEAAREYGEPIYLTTGKRNVFAANTDYRDMLEHLRDARPEDYLLVCGLRHSCAIAGWILGNLQLPLNLLIYNNGSYVPRSLAWLVEQNEQGETT